MSPVWNLVLGGGSLQERWETTRVWLDDRRDEEPYFDRVFTAEFENTLLYRSFVPQRMQQGKQWTFPLVIQQKRLQHALILVLPLLLVRNHPRK